MISRKYCELSIVVVITFIFFKLFYRRYTEVFTDFMIYFSRKGDTEWGRDESRIVKCL